MKSRWLILSVFNLHSHITLPLQEDLHKCYPDARKGQIKCGGPFPYLSAAQEVNLYILIHLKSFVNTKLSPYEKCNEPVNE